MEDSKFSYANLNFFEIQELLNKDNYEDIFGDLINFHWKYSILNQKIYCLNYHSNLLKTALHFELNLLFLLMSLKSLSVSYFKQFFPYIPYILFLEYIIEQLLYLPSLNFLDLL